MGNPSAEETAAAAAALACAIQREKARKIRYKIKKKEAEPAYDCGFCLFLFSKSNANEKTAKRLQAELSSRRARPE